MELERKHFAGIDMVYINGRMVSTTSWQVGELMNDLIENGSTKMLLNLQDVEYVSSAGLRSILVAAKLIQSNDGELRICSAREDVAKILEMSGFDSLISLHADEAEAVAAFD
ncbi:STAS domain-containing protein [Ruegeria lacuscaerulensis]|uniref:STAS domain-containing protein n=1 Tax=Ruegeria lacuscaerulensis TaxID=55218 RepID=UPI00147C2A60|nr:STAS domain-containing protein [Ruegeria lacuscaerulensis]